MAEYLFTFVPGFGLVPTHERFIYEYCVKNGYKNLDFIDFVVSNISDASYGKMWNADGNIIYEKHKAVEINKDKKPPKVCTEIRRSFKVIDNEAEIEKYFRKTNVTEITILEMQEEKMLFA